MSKSCLKKLFGFPIQNECIIASNQFIQILMIVRKDITTFRTTYPWNLPKSYSYKKMRQNIILPPLKMKWSINGTIKMGTSTILQKIAQ